MLPCKKIYIDSKFKTSDSKSTSDFKFELKETNPGTFDIVAKSGGKNDMVKITFNVDDPDGKKVTRSEKINNVETYTAVQIKQQYGDYQGNKSYEEALKAKELI